MRIGKLEVQGLLIDIDGVLYVGDETVEGAVETIRGLTVPFLYLTNTTTCSSRQLREKLRDFGFPVADDQVMTAPMAALAHLRREGSPPVRLILADEVLEDFRDYPTSRETPRAVVVGDIGDAWSYELMDEIFHHVQNGADLIGLHKNRFWKTGSGLHLDIGAFIAGIEYATGKLAHIVGKPRAAFFQSALDRLDLNAEQVAMIGDDIESDVGGSQAHGIRGILVRTGKYRPDVTAQSSVRPDLLLESIAELQQFC